MTLSQNQIKISTDMFWNWGAKIMTLEKILFTDLICAQAPYKDFWIYYNELSYFIINLTLGGIIITKIKLTKSHPLICITGSKNVLSDNFKRKQNIGFCKLCSFPKERAEFT